ncbi:MAG: prenyltransferase [Halieaceae bacterium]|nr:prenyltransferase [Halieaceae bacterium]
MIDIAMWWRALTTMPRVNTAQWQTLDPVAKWLIACRASVFFMTITAAALGGLLAWRAGQFEWDIWFAVCLGLVFAHATNNLLNDYTDSRRGIDSSNYFRNQYGVHVLEDGLLTLRQFYLYLLITGAIGLLLGAWLVWQRSGLTLDLMLAGVFFVLFYSWPLKHYGLGEPAVLLVWGPLMVGGCFYVVAGHWSWDACWLSLVYALGPTTVLFGKHTDKLEADRNMQVNTLPVILGEERSRLAVVVMLAASYLLCLTLVLAGRYSWTLLLVMLNLPYLLKIVRVFGKAKPGLRPTDYPVEIWPLWFSAHAFSHTRRFTSLFLLGCLADIILY